MGAEGGFGNNAVVFPRRLYFVCQFWASALDVVGELSVAKPKAPKVLKISNANVLCISFLSRAQGTSRAAGTHALSLLSYLV